MVHGHDEKHSHPFRSISVSRRRLVGIEFIKRAGHVRAGAAVNVAPILGVDFIQDQGKAGNEGIAFAGRIRLEIQTALLGQEGKAEGFGYRRIFDATEGRRLLTDIDVHDMGEGNLMDLAHFGLGILFPCIRSPGNARLRELQTHRLGLAPTPVCHNQDSGIPELLHGCRNDNFVVLILQIVTRNVIHVGG